MAGVTAGVFCVVCPVSSCQRKKVRSSAAQVCVWLWGRLDAFAGDSWKRWKEIVNVSDEFCFNTFGALNHSC